MHSKMTASTNQESSEDLPGGLVIGTLFPTQGHGSDPWPGNQDPDAAHTYTQNRVLTRSKPHCYPDLRPPAARIVRLITDLWYFAVAVCQGLCRTSLCLSHCCVAASRVLEDPLMGHCSHSEEAEVRAKDRWKKPIGWKSRAAVCTSRELLMTLWAPGSRTAFKLTHQWSPLLEAKRCF